MDDGASPVIGLIVFALLIICNMIFYGFRAAVDNVSDIMVDKQAEDGDKKAQVIQRFLDEPSKFTFQISLLNILFSGAFVIIETILFRTSLWVVLLMLTATLLADVFTAQKVAARKPEKWAFSLVHIVNFFLKILFPIFWILDKGSDGLIRVMGLDPATNVDDVTEEEIMSMVNDGHEQGVLQESEAEMIQNIFEFGDKEAKDIMTHRKSIVAIDSEMNFEDALRFMQEKNNSRFPVYTETIDNIIGVIHIKDVLVHSQETAVFQKRITEIKGLVREIDFIPETRNINTLFKEMQLNKYHMVIVVDEYGQTSGLVAMEDIIEEIVGNIFDEYDEEESMIQQQADGSFLMKGMTSLEEVTDALDVELDVEDYETLNGFLISKIDKIPGDDDTFTVESDGWIFHVLLVKNKMIQSVHVMKAKIIENSDSEIKSCQEQERMVE